jgi:hypothetical protein
MTENNSAGRIHAVAFELPYQSCMDDRQPKELDNYCVFEG